MSNGEPKQPIDKLANDVVAKDAVTGLPRPGKGQPRTLSDLPLRIVVPAAIAILVIAGGGIFFVTHRGGASPSNASPSNANTVAVGSINCDCANTQAPDIGGAATRQCQDYERKLKEAAAAKKVQLVVSNGKITGFQGVAILCDDVTSGPAAWPLVGAPAKSPYG